MNDIQKKLQLRKYKMFATGLFVLMAIIFMLMSILENSYSAFWIGCVRAFSEAAMVGALADWFAVTALFHHPLGLKIPHTNLIENGKQKIGDNLGHFVVNNFLSPENIRPYILKLKVSNFLGEWLDKGSNQEKMVKQASSFVLDLLSELDDTAVVNFISKKAMSMTDNLKVNQIIGHGINYILDKKDHQKIITDLSKQIKDYVVNNLDLVKEKVKKGSHFGSCQHSCTF